MKKENLVVKKECHSQKFLLGISHIRFRKWVQLFKQKGDPRQNSSGMTPNLMGFTLIELLVVVLIIGILAAVAVPQYQKAVYKSRYATLKHLVKSITEAQEVYYLTNGSYTDKFSDLDVDMPASKTNESTDSRYKYDWGWCAVQKGTIAQATCENNKIRMGYQQRFEHSGGPLDRFCIAFSTTLNSVQNQVCQAETGAITKYYSEDTYISWKY